MVTVFTIPWHMQHDNQQNQVRHLFDESTSLSTSNEFHVQTVFDDVTNWHKTLFLTDRYLKPIFDIMTHEFRLIRLMFAKVIKFKFMDAMNPQGGINTFTICDNFSCNKIKKRVFSYNIHIQYVVYGILAPVLFVLNRTKNYLMVVRL